MLRHGRPVATVDPVTFDRPQDDPATAEKLRATEQWLEQIPDDPAGLLKRKFELQYKQMYGDKPNEGDPW